MITSLLLAFSLSVVAAPPLPPFPTELRPRDASTAPFTAAFYALGDPAPNVDVVGAAVTINGEPDAAPTVDKIGCCVIRVRFDSEPEEGDVISVTLTSPAGDASATWTAGPLDNSAPTFAVAPSVIQHGVSGGVYEVAIGFEVADDTQIGMITASYEGEIVGATVDGYLLRARLDASLPAGEHCLSIVAVDVAENESPPSELCFTVDPAGEGEGEGEGDGDEPPSGCAATSSTTLGALSLLAFFLMRTRKRMRAPRILGLGLGLVLVAALSATSARAEGVTWQSGSFDDVMKRAKAEKKLVFVEVWATWCAPCKKQAAEVFETADGATLTTSMLAWRVDFDEPSQRALMERWNVLSLPTILVVRPDGTEVDRIEGYDTKDAFLVEARAIAKGTDPLPTLEAKLKKAPNDAQLVLEVGHRKLVRGDAEGARMLERLVVDDTGEPAQEALFLLGRYHSRVKRDFAVAKHVWRELYTRFPAGKYANTAAWWYAGALHETKDTAAALSFLEARARKSWDAKALAALVDFVVEKKLDATAARRVLDEATKASIETRELRAKLGA